MSILGPVTVWLVDVASLDEGVLLALQQCLGESEMRRFRRFVRRERQRQFLVGRVLLRQVVGRLLGVAPQTIQLSERPGQAPLLALADATLSVPFFSISHSGRWVACAVSADTPLGLDIEVINPARDLCALARQAFGAAAAAALAELPDATRPARFYQLWSQHEARYKLGECAAPVCISLQHPELSVVLCSASALAPAPQLRPASLAPQVWGQV